MEFLVTGLAFIIFWLLVASGLDATKAALIVGVIFLAVGIIIAWKPWNRV